MSHILWKYYWENDVERFSRHLSSTSHATHPAKSPGGPVGTSPGAFASSPRNALKSRKPSGLAASHPSKNAAALTKAEVNSRDHAGLTILLRAAISPNPGAVAFVKALVNHPAVDIHAQDAENGWNALHRALYAGNVSIARLLLERERRDLVESIGGPAAKVGQLIKTKDAEGNSPFDVYNNTIALRTLKCAQDDAGSDDGSDIESASGDDDVRQHGKNQGLGEEVFTFGSNNNLSLGLGDEDDRQYPERVQLKRPDHLLHHFHDQQLASKGPSDSSEPSSAGERDLAQVPALIQNRPIVVQDVVLSKFHSAILTTDPFSNLYVCGIGRGGRLGLGDENTRFSFAPVQAGLSDQKVVQVALGQSHTMALTSSGELWMWGSNKYAQLGFTLPAPSKPDEEACLNVPRQVFGSLKKEVILGIAASSNHSVAHTGSALFCWGKNDGQLGLMDADSRSLEVQPVPRKVAPTQLAGRSIVMVSATDKATSCLFEDFTICIFTNYGYRPIKIPPPDGLSNLALHRSAGAFGASRPHHERHAVSMYPERAHITEIASGGDTIAAVAATGELYTIKVNTYAENDHSVASTTNPTKIKDAVGAPQCIWSSNKDGVKSVGVAEHGSVIIATQSGAVWRRVKRTKAKDTKLASKAKKSDFKFQRVPCITDIVAVRSSTFGAFAAIRKDADVTKEQIEISSPSLWADLGSLLSMSGFRAENPPSRVNKDTWDLQDREMLRNRINDDLAYEILTCTDLEADVRTHLTNWGYAQGSLGMVIQSASHPDLQIPVHSWVLAARSPCLKTGLEYFQDLGSYESPDLFTISQDGDLAVIELTSGLDLLTLLNLVVYMYTDRVIPAWNLAQQSSPLAYRYRQVRAELMKLATKLGLVKLEAAVRSQTSPSPSMDMDFAAAIESSSYFDDGDALLELDGDEIPVHSALLCKRCPWFEGLFNGRSRGKWLESRRAAQEDLDPVSIDLSHMDPESFHYVLRFLYTDAAERLFEDTLAENIDEFSELVMDVMGIANELMLDRLSQTCQRVLGQFVTTRNISILLNLISPCSVSEFKDKALEQICLVLENLLENGLLDNLDEDLLLDLDEVVRDNQLARCPFARSGMAEALLFERNPLLAEDVLEERQVRVREMAFKAMVARDDEKKLSSSFKTRFGSMEDFAASPTTEKTRRSSRTPRNEPFSPSLRPKDSQTDLIFSMDEDDLTGPNGAFSPVQRPLNLGNKGDPGQESGRPVPGASASNRKAAQDGSLRICSDLSQEPGSAPDHLGSIGKSAQRQVSARGSPWAQTPFVAPRLDLSDVLKETKPAESALTAGLAAENKASGGRPVPQKLSQKDRKKHLQQQAEEAARREAQVESASQTPWVKVGERNGSPWEKTPTAPKASMKDLLSPEAAPPSPASTSKPLVAAEASSGKSISRRTASPDTRFSGQKSSPAPTTSSKAPVRASPQPLVPHSKSYIQKSPRPEQELGVGLADIIGEQRREQESVREAVAKRSLQEIQQEQAFQEWWDQESKRTQEEEASRQARTKSKSEKKDQGANGGKGGNRRGRGSKAKAGSHRGGEGEASHSTSAQEGGAQPAGRGSGGGGRGRGRGGRGGKAA